MPESTIYLRRRDRRALMRKAGLPWAAAAQYNNGEHPLVRVVQRLIYWKGLAKYGEQGFYHVFGQCKQLFKEWAGRSDLREGRADHPIGNGQVSRLPPGFRGGQDVLKHGNGGYVSGCRCAVCVEGARLRMRAYAATEAGRAAVARSNAVQRMKGRARIAAARAAPCHDCGDTEQPHEFDHLPGHRKMRNVAGMARYSAAAIAAEIAKCEVVCKPCHQQRTAARLRTY